MFFSMNKEMKAKIRGYFSIKNKSGTSLVVQWLRIHLPIQGMWVQMLVRELRFHMQWGNQAHTLQLLNLHATATQRPEHHN